MKVNVGTGVLETSGSDITLEKDEILWVSIKGHSIRIFPTSIGISIDCFDLGHEISGSKGHYEIYDKN